LAVSALKNIVRRLPFLTNRVPSLSMLRAPGQHKYLPLWFRSRRSNFLLERRLPWLTFDATGYLKTQLKRNLKVFEYGGGGSTLFWLSYDADCTTVEHDAAWCETLRRYFPKDALIDLRLVEPDATLHEPRDTRDISDPAGYWTDWDAFADHTFYTYAHQIDTFPDASFDVVLVDGQARPSCIACSYRKGKQGGMLIIDNADVPIYLTQTLPLLTNFKRLRFPGIAPIHGALSETDVFIREGV